jgi:hypothetical protein
MVCPLDGARVASAPLPLIESASLWRRFRAGEAVKCPKTGSSFALSVDGSASVYRIGCTECGMSTAWFEPNGDSILERDEVGEPGLGDE